jgi:hypothetical protein
MTLEQLKMNDGNRNEGNFVKSLQGETGVGFEEGTHVHKDWWAKTISYDEGREKAQRAAEERIDLTVPASKIKGVVAETLLPTGHTGHEFRLHVDGRDFVPTDYALTLFSQKAGLPSSTMMKVIRAGGGFDAQDAKLMSDAANNYLRRLPQDKEYFVRANTDGTMRAFLSDKYAPIDNRWFLDTIEELVPEGRLSHWRSDEDTMYGNVLIPETIMDKPDGDSDYGGMLSLGNCEIGKRKASTLPSIFRAICLNGCIWGSVSGTAYKRRHVGTIDLDALKAGIASNLTAQLPLLPTAIDALLDTRRFTTSAVPLKNVIGIVSKDHKLSAGEASKVAEEFRTYESAHRSLFGIVNAITRAGQKGSNERWVAMDEVGGKLVSSSEPYWNDVLHRADRLKESELKKLFVAA